MGLVGLTLFAKEGVRFVDIKTTKSALRRLIEHTKSYGIPLHVGAVAAVAMSYLGIIILGNFTDSTGVGFFALAQTIAIPLTIVGGAIGSVYFSAFAGMERIHPRILMTAVTLCVLAFAAYQCLIGFIFFSVFPKTYSGALALARIAAVGYTLHGLGDLLNRFLCANGHVRNVRNSAMLVGVVSLISYFALSKWLSEVGAAVAIVLSSSTYLLLMGICYFRSVRLKVAEVVLVSN
jgi:O-antigen/teichoic acid export membrane protein